MSDQMTATAREVQMVALTLGSATTLPADEMTEAMQAWNDLAPEQQGYFDPPDLVLPEPDWLVLPSEIQPLPQTADEAREQGFTAEDVEEFRAVGIIATERWEPQTVEDVEWIARRLAECDTEEDRRRSQLDRHLLAIQRRRESLARFEPLCFAITRAAIPRKKDGTLARKSFDGEQFRLKIVEREPAPRVTDEAAVLDYLRKDPHAAPGLLATGLRLTLTKKTELWGIAALAHECRQDEVMALKVLSAPVLAYLATLPPVREIDEHGAVTETPALIPGVEMTDAIQAWDYERAKDAAA